MAENDPHPASGADIDDEHARTYRMFVKLLQYAAAGTAVLLILLAVLLR